jgi:hypothetical protein
MIYKLDADGAGIGGTTLREYEYHNFSSLYIDGTLSADFGERLGAEISTRWAIPTSTNDVRHKDFNGPLLGGRTWNTYTLWSVLDANVSYALVKDASVLKSFKPKVGVRWDYWKMYYEDPFDVSPGFAVAAPWDTAEFYSSAIMPYAGFSATFGGLQWGMFGGDLEFEAVGGILAWGKAKHEETRDLGGTRHDVFEGSLDKGYFYELSLDYNVLTLELSPKVTGTVGVFGKLSGYHADGNLEGSRNDVVLDDFDFEMDRTLFVTGINLAIMFDIYGKPAPAPPAPAPAPVIEPKLEPMSKN